MKIKTQPDDFIVEEILGIKPASSGDYHLYRAEKRSLNTTDLIPRIADVFRVPRGAIAYGGRKDKHALAIQHLSVRSQKPLPKTLKQQNLQLALIGFLDRPMGPDLISGNRFTLTLRDLSIEEKEGVIKELSSIRTFGYPNYFDDQRFGSYDNKQGFLAEKILKKHDNGAVKIYITRFGTEDNKKEQDRKKEIFEHWGHWEACLKIAETDAEKYTFRHLQKHPGDFRSLLRRIPRDELSSFFTSYQSYLWNEILRRLLSRLVKTPRTSPGRLGPYLFYNTLEEKEEALLKTLIIPLPAGKIPPDPPEIHAITESIFAEQGLKSSQFNLKKIRQAFFKPVLRSAIVLPQDLSPTIQSDDKHIGRYKTILRFTLPRGSYATMLAKRIFSTQT